MEQTSQVYCATDVDTHKVMPLFAKEEHGSVTDPEWMIGVLLFNNWNCVLIVLRLVYATNLGFMAS